MYAGLSVLLGTSIDSCNEPNENKPETWVADSGATYHATRLHDSADMMRDIRPTIDKVRAGASRLVDIVGYGAPTVAFPGNLTVKLLDVAFMPQLSRNRFSLMTAHRPGVGFKTEESGMRISLRDGRLRFEREGSGYSGFGCRIEPDGDCCVQTTSRDLQPPRQPRER